MHTCKFPLPVILVPFIIIIIWFECNLFHISHKNFFVELSFFCVWVFIFVSFGEEYPMNMTDETEMKGGGIHIGANSLHIFHYYLFHIFFCVFYILKK